MKNSAKATRPRGIKWSAPVLIRRDGAALAVTLPEQVVGALHVGAGDVLNFTELPDGHIEVWMVKKGGYAGLDAMVEGKSSALGAGGAARKTDKGSKPAKATKTKGAKR